jgi:3',5'-nucleoside bisphosphate phosphatase
VSGLQAAQLAAAELGLKMICGVEISVSFAHETVHIVGLNIDPHNPALVGGLEHTRSGRERRARLMSEGLARVGIKGAYEGAMKFVGNPNLISRTHFARYLVESKVCENTHDVFRKYLTEGKPGYVEQQWAKLSESVAWIVGAGGVAVIAHPGRYKFTPTEEMALFEEFKALGGEAIEVITGSHSTADFAKYAEWAGTMGFMASRGSDFHSPEESHTDLGQWDRLPAIPDYLMPVWSRFV